MTSGQPSGSRQSDKARPGGQQSGGPPPEFQRARSAEQREARRTAILAVAAELLDEMPVSDVSLRELSRRVGLSKTNVVRYFETREAVFFELLNRSVGEWLDALPADLPPAPADRPAGTGDVQGAEPVHPAAVVDAWARSLARRPLICALWSALGTELERNISAEAVRDFKIAHADLQVRLADLVRKRVPALTPSGARELVALSVVVVAGLWPFANPSTSVAEAVEDPRLAHTRVDFAERLSRALVLGVTGLLHV